MTGNRLYKKEKLCSLTAIEQLFSPSLQKEGGNNTIMAYPWRCVWRINDSRTINCSKFLISVPKKRQRHAVDRVKMRRRMREAYRLHRNLLPAGCKIDMVIIYVANSITDYRSCSRSIKKIFGRITETINQKSESF